jgi:hypothetical protein
VGEKGSQVKILKRGKKQNVVKNESIGMRIQRGSVSCNMTGKNGVAWDRVFSTHLTL